MFRRNCFICLSVDYALAPEHPFPMPLDDCIAAVRWAASEGAALGVDAKRLALIGDSAAAIWRSPSALPCVTPAISRYAAPRRLTPYFDLDTPSQRAYGGGPYFLGTPDIRRYLDDYLPDQAARENPLAVPMLAQLGNFPPLYIAACEYDPLLDEPETPRRARRAAGVQSEFHLWEGMAHGAVSLMGWIDAMGRGRSDQDLCDDVWPVLARGIALRDARRTSS